MKPLLLTLLPAGDDRTCGFEEWDGEKMGHCGEPAVALVKNTGLCEEHARYVYGGRVKELGGSERIGPAARKLFDEHMKNRGL